MIEAIGMLLIAAFQGYILQKLDKFDERMDKFELLIQRKPRRKSDNIQEE